uniref:Seizure related 6 homolog (mouse)-like 2 n=1 Tax=Oryzias sinensis TaxID=183150 RepID=A0A8C7XG03_9TELE
MIHMPVFIFTVQCNASLSAMEDVVESPDHASSSPLECTYSITVYPGYGVEIKVRKANLSKEESLMIMGRGGSGPELLANETLMKEGQVIRSTTNQVYIHYRSLRQSNHGTFSLHYQAFLLSCPFPMSPEGGGVTVTDIHPGGQAHFHCDRGFQIRGHEVATCVNTTQPHWSTPGPQLVSCGGWIRNATVGRILSPPPSPSSNQSNGNNLTCHWLIEAKEGHKLHLHFERIALDEDNDKLIVRSGNSSVSAPLFDSDLDDVPERGLLSESSTLYLELTADSSAIPLLLALRYEAFDDEHCWEPFMPNGNFTSSDISYQLGTIVTFSCSPGFIMDPGSGTIECVDPNNPHWNDSEPVCKALCGGELSDPSGPILSPDWPQSYSKGLDCVWQIHGNEEKHIELDIRTLNISQNDVLTVFDGRDVMSRVIGQYQGSKERFQVVSTGSEVTIQFQSDPEDAASVLNRGFFIQYREVEPNDTCPTLPEIEFGWSSSSHSFPVRGSVLTYQCQPGYDISGSDIITCQWDLSWSSSPPTCVKVPQCLDPGEVVNGARSVRPEAGFVVGTVVRFSCNQGYQLEGPSQISCHGRDTGTPKWSDRSPKCVCKAHFLSNENIALAIILPIILVILLIGGIYIICRLEWKPRFWKSLSHTHSYSPITVESDFNNPLYEAGDTREYEVSI